MQAPNLQHLQSTIQPSVKNKARNTLAETPSVNADHYAIVGGTPAPKNATMNPKIVKAKSSMLDLQSNELSQNREFSKAQASQSSVTNFSVAQRNNQFEKKYGQRLDQALIGDNELDTSALNRDLMSVTNDMANLLKKSKKVAEKEKSKAVQQLAVKP